MSDDQMIVRNTEPGTVNLSLGEPYFLHETFNEVFLDNKLVIEPGKLAAYPLYGGQEELLEELSLKHPNEEIIVSNGGKQGLLAAFYALKIQKDNPDLLVQHQPSIYWPSYPTLSQISGLSFDCRLGVNNALKVLTIPNNPDGSISFNTDIIYDIADMAYAHPIYGYDENNKPNALIHVWSASKVLGFSGLRVGWLTTKDKNLAHHLRHYMEITTSGVSTVSQKTLSAILKTLKKFPEVEKDFYKRAKEKLIKNGELFNQYLGEYCRNITGVPATNTGMFAFFQVKNEYIDIFKNPKVKLVNGEACGKMDQSWFRMSMGHTNAITEEAMKILTNK